MLKSGKLLKKQEKREPMIDFHTHLLPGIDDGSRDIDETEELLDMEERQGVNQIIVTPHFYASRDSVDRFLKRRSDSYEKIKPLFERKKDIAGLYFGAEVYFFSGIGDARMLPKLCIEGTDVLLLEMPFCQWDDVIYENVKKIIHEQRLTVVLAHIERYVGFQKNTDVWERVMSLPLYQQINGGCFLDWKRRRFPVKYLKEGHTAVLGSDCHNMHLRKPNLEEARAYLQKKAGSMILDRCDNLAAELIKGAKNKLAS